ncbi:glycolate oxidase subunit GlcE [Rhizobium ruizarguesonis]|uniref:glycolate oxidase subunit GlcE n=1 Tax=Rhizobium ruizarguesonis TaxID=2081791 RepID=UPI00103048C9|nr:glycolate oxidase subunit GlcE [Rhizobium ruizarguesonis]QIJ39128.1 glycolate oxidase subunit GlcE [Rhizobium leguminosarum]NEH30748.1 glycolate oxidase subunit GlcE [Rhizobium ruizarguesonis]NEJ07146.1 glycolate oxidase subunit GlcE [Rhizobium ruizarguesonis]NEK11041.1 glycolate oxidase subunit GlcE [Rhizobium ruizarguesonis]TAU08738.1 glycolate oxidase subunit GlcE [Rhizobium ruizarguesonis]
MIDLMPTSEEEAAGIVRAHAEAGRSLDIRGGDTRSGFGNAVSAEDRLRSTGLSGIVAYNPGEMVMTVRSGTPLAEVETALSESGQMLAFEPMDHRPVMGTSGEPTIGGVFAANVSGPRRLIAGAARDSLLGARFVNGKGEIIKAGGRVMKNVTGLDLVKLIAGSHGTLGILTEVTFRVPPRPKTERTVVLSGLNDAEAANAMAAAMALPVEVSGAAHLPLTVTWKFLAGKLPEGEATVLRIEGLPGSVDVRIEKLAAAMSAFATVTRLEQPESSRLWQEIREVLPYADGTTRPVWRVSVAPGTGHQLVAALRLGAGVDAFYDWQGGLVWMRMEAGPEAEQVRRYIKALGGGHATLIRASDEARAVTAAFHPEPEAVAMLSRRVKEKFDPAGIFNPGKMG